MRQFCHQFLKWFPGFVGASAVAVAGVWDEAAAWIASQATLVWATVTEPLGALVVLLVAAGYVAAVILTGTERGKQQATIDDLVAALRVLKGPEPQVEIAVGLQNLTTLSNADLKQRVSALAQRMRRFELDRREARFSIQTSGNANRNAEFMQKYALDQAEFNQDHRPEALGLRDEMRRRLGISTPRTVDSVALDIGILAGPTPISDGAAELEGLARKLPN